MSEANFRELTVDEAREVLARKRGAHPLSAAALPPFALERYFARWEFAARYNLAASDVEGFTLDELLALADSDGRRAWETLRLGYTESAGLPALREAIAATYRTVAADDVLTFAGAEEGIYLAMHALLGPGTHAVVVWPGYQSLYDVARATGADVTPIALAARDGWELEVDAVIAAIRPETRIVVINFPHNPTGATIPVAALERLAEHCESVGIHLFSDEVYRLLEHDPAARLPAAVDLGHRTLSLGVMSKAYGLAGLRIGWIATHDGATRRRLAELKDYTTICNSAPSEVLALIALRAHETVLRRSRGILETNLPPLRRFVERHADLIEWTRPDGGTVAFPRWRRADAGAVADALAERFGVLILPGVVFGADPARFRIGFGRSDFSAGLERLEEALGELQPLVAPSV